MSVKWKRSNSRYAKIGLLIIFLYENTHQENVANRILMCVDGGRRVNYIVYDEMGKRKKEVTSKVICDSLMPDGNRTRGLWSPPTLTGDGMQMKKQYHNIYICN